MRVHLHVHTQDIGAHFDESKHKRDGGKFSSTGGAGKGPSESNKEHGDKAAPQAAAARKNTGPKAEAHSEALGAWADARKHLDPDKPMAEQSAAYKTARAKAELLSAKADRLRKDGTEKPLPGGQEAPNTQGKGQPADKGELRKKHARAVRLGNDADAKRLLQQLKRGIEESDPDGKGKVKG